MHEYWTCIQESTIGNGVFPSALISILVTVKQLKLNLGKTNGWLEQHQL